MIYGYARVGTEDQKLNLQLDALKNAKCDKIFKEKISAAKERPELEKMIGLLTKGDRVVVWKLDRLGRSLRHLIDLVKGFEEKEVKFVSIQDNIDTTTAQGRFIFNLFASLAEFERDVIRERTHAGLSAARARGRTGGRPKGLSLEAQLKAQYAKKLYADRLLSILEICKKWA
jgi:DNA invertase Pin-like site-specific DNA recombinase